VADRKITDLTALTTPATGDLIPIVDISEAAAADKNKKITVGELFKGVPDGTAAAPSVAFTGSGTDTGIYSPGVDQVAVATNGVGRVFVDANGDVSLPRASGGYMFQTGGSIRAGIRSNDNNELLFNRGTDSTEMVLTATGVGIGTTSPASALHVVTSGAGEIRHADGARTVSMGSTGTISYIGSVTPGNGLALYSANEEKARIDASGRLLVGASSAIQTSSNSLIQVASSTGGYYIAARSDTSVSTDNVIGGMRFYGNDSDGNYDECARIECAADGGHGDDNKQSRLAFFTTASGASSPTERMRITSAGRVGIGTASPQATLHLESSAGAQLRIKSGVGNAQIDLIAAGQTNPFYIYCNSSRNLVFQDNSAERARIDSSGRLLVGSSIGGDVNYGGGTGGFHLVNGNADPHLMIRRAGGNGSLTLVRSNGTVAAPTVVANNDVIGQIRFVPYDGTDYTLQCARISAEIDGTPGANDVPGRLTFSTTADGASTPTERMRITNAGFVGIGTASPGFPLHVQGSGVQEIAVGSTNAGGATIFLDGDANGDVSGGDYAYLRHNTDGNLDITNLKTGAIIFSGTGAIERARIDSSGRLGIGTSSVTNDANLDIQLSTVPATDTYAKLQLRSGNYGYIIKGGLKQGSGGQLHFDLNNNGSVSTQMVLDTGGRLGIGTTSPTVILQARNDTTTAYSQGTEPSTTTLVQNLDTTTAYTPAISQWQARGSTTTTSVWYAGNAGLNNAYSQSAFVIGNRTGASSYAERLRIAGDGTFITFSAGNGIVSAHSAAAGTSVQMFMGIHSRTSTTVGGTTSFQVWTNGNVQNTNNSYGAISDIKLKENIVDANSQWDDLKAVQVRKYSFKEETGNPTHTQIGVIAQELELVSPGLVYESPDRDEDGNDLGTVTKSVNYSVLYMKAVKALQEAMERIETLEAKVAALESV
jgi:hypothetical protein